MSEQTGLICAYALDGSGGGRALGWPELDAALAGDGLSWIHLDHRVADSARWLTERSGLDPVARMSSVLSDLDERLDGLEDTALTTKSRDVQTKLAAVRRRAIGLRRYIAPQREALSRLRALDVAWLDQLDRARLSEVADFVTRYVEDLEAARERAAVIQDELSSRLAHEMDRTMYVLTVVAAIFLPLGLITELFGVGLGGMPGADTPWAFAALCVVLAILAVIEVLLFRRLKWL